MHIIAPMTSPKRLENLLGFSAGQQFAEAGVKFVSRTVPPYTTRARHNIGVDGVGNLRLL